MAYLRNSGLNKISYPVGHVIQTAGDTHAVSTTTNITTASTGYIGSDLQAVLTTRSTKNYLLCQLFLTGIWISVSGRNLMTGLEYSTDTFSSHSATLGEKEFFSINTGYLGGGFNSLTSVELGLDHTATLWAIVPVVATITIRPRFGGYNNNLIGIGVNSTGTKGSFNLSVSEIQQ